MLFRSQEIIAHPDHSILTKRNDIALIRLTQNITFSNRIAAACLETNSRDQDSAVPLIVTGWGSTSAKRKLYQFNLIDSRQFKSIQYNSIKSKYQFHFNSIQFKSIQL